MSFVLLHCQTTREALCYMWYMAVKQEPPTRLGRKLFKTGSIYIFVGVGAEAERTQQSVGKNPKPSWVAQMWLRRKDCSEAQQLYQILGLSTPQVFHKYVKRYMSKDAAAAAGPLQPLPVGCVALRCCAAVAPHPMVLITDCVCWGAAASCSVCVLLLQLTPWFSPPCVTAVPTGGGGCCSCCA